MQTLRRVLVALGAAGLAALFLRLRGSGGTPPRHGGWRQIPLTELDDGDEPGVGAEPAGPE
ncbi:MAG: hypothetical protein M0Z42_26355 [Actinomycetota bacterium]|nr:hypothetical protein [Actinomycetota bacterium]